MNGMQGPPRTPVIEKTENTADIRSVAPSESLMLQSYCIKGLLGRLKYQSAPPSHETRSSQKLHHVSRKRENCITVSLTHQNQSGMSSKEGVIIARELPVGNRFARQDSFCGLGPTWYLNHWRLTLASTGKGKAMLSWLLSLGTSSLLTWRRMASMSSWKQVTGTNIHSEVYGSGKAHGCPWESRCPASNRLKSLNSFKSW